MIYNENKVDDVQIAYIGGGSRGWAWNLMIDLAVEEQLGGTVRLYDTNWDAARKNEIIGNSLKNQPDAKEGFIYKAMDSLKEALVGADFVIISILPGTFDEMESDVHAPEKYGIYQSVGDTTGPGGIIRALRTLPMYVEIAHAIENYCPDAWVINYTNPMGACVRTLYSVFPKIKAFGCCHEVFGTQELIAHFLCEERGIEKIAREEIKVNVQGVNHFTWLSRIEYNGENVVPVYAKMADKYRESGFEPGQANNWMNNHFSNANLVKFDLFNRYGVAAAAGDRHLAEFCPPWYLKDHETVKKWKFSLTPVQWRKDNLAKLLEKSQKMIVGEEDMKLKTSGEEGVKQMKALLGLGSFVTNVNLPNYGQLSNVTPGTVVETNAMFSKNRVQPIFSGCMEESVLALTLPHIYGQKLVVDACMTKDMAPAFKAFATNPLMTASLDDTKALFDTMIKNTDRYLEYYR
ncbi:MAG: alpha-glucosidase/alpha-galactosidase [Clostridiaceae bacterium]